MKTCTLTDKPQMQNYLEQVWTLLVNSYKKVSGGLHYTSPQHLLTETHRWRIVLRHGRVIAVTIFKAKRGWKLVAMAKCASSGQRSRSALQRLIKADLHRCWMELSEGAEHFVLKYCGGQHFIIHASLAARLLNKPVQLVISDSFHYQREVVGILKSKVIVGTPEFA